MMTIYNFLLSIATLLYVPKLIMRMRQAENRGVFLRERFGRLSEETINRVRDRKVLWLHAVSVGEVMAARYWIKLFLDTYGDWMVALSVTTPAGHAVARDIASDRVLVIFAPLDFGPIVRRVISGLKPKLIVLIETEIWPNLIFESSRSRIPIGIINGRISPRSFRRYRLARRWILSILCKLSFCLVQTGRDRAHFEALGMPRDRLDLTGNMKFDQMTLNGVKERMSENVRVSGHVIIGGSTSDGEEALLLHAFEKLIRMYPTVKLILAPRHLERVPSVTQTIKRFGFSYSLYSKITSEAWQVLLVDRIGVLSSLYNLSEIVFVGGSFGARGGQNPIEAAFCRKPILHGPDVVNFDEVYHKLDEGGGACAVRSKDDLLKQIDVLLKNPSLRAEMGGLAFRVVDSMKGASARNLSYLSRWIRAGIQIQKWQSFEPVDVRN